MAGRKRTVTDLTILCEFLLSSDPVQTSSELVDPLDMTRQGVHSRLQSLEELGYLDSKEAGSKARVWWITDAGRSYVDQNRSAEES